MCCSLSFRLWAFYFFPFVLSFLLYVLFGGNDIVGNAPAWLYSVNLLCIVLTLGGFLGALSIEKSAFVRKRLLVSNEDTRRRVVSTLAFVKVGIFALLLLFNTLMYCLAAYADTPKYCVLISLILGIFVFPRLNFSSQSSES